MVSHGFKVVQDFVHPQYARVIVSNLGKRFAAHLDMGPTCEPSSSERGTYKSPESPDPTHKWSIVVGNAHVLRVRRRLQVKPNGYQQLTSLANRTTK